MAKKASNAAPKKPKLSKASAKLIAKGRASFLPCYKQREMIIDRGRGAKIWDLDGNEYIDFGAGIAVCALGDTNDELIKALTKQAKKIWHTSNIFFTEPPILLAEELIKASKFAKRVFFSNSGGEANEAAIKLARKYAADKGKPPEKRTIITFQGSFHGRTMATVTATAQPKYQHGFEPLPGGFEYCPYNDFDAIERMMGDHVCAILCEVVQGEGGIVPAKPGFLTHLRKLCDRHGALLMLDEIQDGMLRTGKLFSHWLEPGCKPDVVTLAKALGGGFPMGAMLVGERAAETFQFGNHGSTFGGNPLGAAVARVVLKKLQSKPLQKNVAARSKQLMRGLETIGKEFGLFREVRGRGLMIGAELNAPWTGNAGDISDACRKAGVIVLQAGPGVLRCVPPLVITEKEVDIGLKRLRAGIAAFLDTPPGVGMLLVRPVRVQDHDEILGLADLAGIGMTSLPPDPRVLDEKITRSVNSFAGSPEYPQGESFLFALEDTETKKIVGTTGIVAHVGVARPFYSYKLSTIVQASERLSIYSLNRVLHMVNDYTGATEIGSLFLVPEYRQGGNGRFLSRCRHLMMAEFPQLFSDTVISEIRGVQNVKGESPFYNHLAKHFFQMDFQACDFTYATQGGQFIADLMPRYPIYVKLLAAEAQEVIGVPLHASQPARKMLEEEGFAYEGYLDIFDGGPTLQCEREQIRTVRESRRARVKRVEKTIDVPLLHMVINTSLERVAVVRTPLLVEEDGVVLCAEAVRALQVDVGSEVRYAL